MTPEGTTPSTTEPSTRPVAVRQQRCLDGNEAAALVAHSLSDICAIYPITPASAMGELADAWSGNGRLNLWGSVPEVIEMQSEGGAAAALHGAIQKGALATSFTASQGLLLMIPTMFKVAGELTPTVLHVAARAIATHALSIFGDHSDVMSVRSTGWAMLCASDVQEAHDFALVSHAATLRARVPFLHFFDGFRTSHEVATVTLLDDDDLRVLVHEDDVLRHRAHGLTPEAPVLRGSAQNPDVFFQAREAANLHYDAVPATVAQVMKELGERTGRSYSLVDYHGHPEADRVIVAMGSATGTIRETVDVLVGRGEKVGVAVVRLYRPFPAEALRAAIPATAARIAVLDRTKEPGAPAEPLHLDVMAAFTGDGDTLIIGGRYGLGSKEFTPADAKAVFDELARTTPRMRFTVGIVDDVTHLSLDTDDFRVPTTAVQAMFFGLGSDGTVGANKTSIKLIGEHTDQYAQGYFVYDSKKSGSMTVSHLRFGPDPIRSAYLIDSADFVACHQFGLLSRVDVLATARTGATVLLNSPYSAADVWDHLPGTVQARIIEKGLELYVVDATTIARDAGLGPRINTVMQPCFFALADVLPRETAIRLVKESVEKAYARRGPDVVARNLVAIDAALAALRKVDVPATLSEILLDPRLQEETVVEALIAGRGDSLPVSAMSIDGTFPTGTAALEKRALADEIPVWDPSICIDCGKCTIVCPHAAIRMKAFSPDAIEGAPDGFKSKTYATRDLPAGTLLTVQVAPDDCTGCGICVAVCPVRDKADPTHKAIDLMPALEHRDVERPHFEFFLDIPDVDRTAVRTETVKGSQLLTPLFEFSGACAGCGETPYLKLLTQLMGDRMVVANATGCSSIYGGNLPTTPWAKDSEGRGPAWANSLFEDNAEFGLGIRLGVERQASDARRLLAALAPQLPVDVVDALLAEAPAVTDEAGMQKRREDVAALRGALGALDSPTATSLASLADALVPTAVWIVGGDGWAYDIDFGGLDHVLASGRNVNILVLDTEVYSNTGGQASKSTPRGASAKFASHGKATKKKDLGLLAQAYGDVYVAQIAMGANETQTVRALLEAAAWPGPSLVLAYSTCIAHGIEMSTSMGHQKAAVTSGYWPLYRFHPSPDAGAHPFSLDSKKPTTSLADFTSEETRYTALDREDHERAEHLLELAQADIDERWHYYEQLAGVERSLSADPEEELGHLDHHAEQPETD
ncbi:MAG TPA: pyruvate:ferredoxin (flavodoxin) oxidoreductase [Candidatus Nanopelagicales bacterium]|nr:pyruvate:ferredoxin (flavodoxin) oxidoreductase [Candidatus Nanopelagicales bacterium]